MLHVRPKTLNPISHMMHTCQLMHISFCLAYDYRVMGIKLQDDEVKICRRYPCRASEDRVFRSMDMTHGG